MNHILLTHQFKYFWRSKGRNKSIITQILIALVLLYLLAVACLLGFSLKPLLQKHYGIANAVNAFCGFILYYFTIDIAFRFQWQELPTLAVQPYLLQNIRRNKLIAFLNIRSLFSFLNLLPLLVFIPFISSVISKENGAIAALAFAISILALCGGNHFLILFIKRKTINSNKWLFAFIIVIAAFGLLNYFDIISIRKFSTLVFKDILYKPWLCIVAIIYTAFSFYINSRLLRSNFYFEESSVLSNSEKLSQNSLLGKIATKGSLIDLEIKSILRNKRPRSLFFLSFIFLGYGFLMFKKHLLEQNQFGVAIIGSVIITGMFALSYGQFLFAWQSAYFDGLMANNINFKTYIKSKFRLITVVCTFSFLLSLFYGLIDWHVVFILLAVYLFNIGVQPIIAAYFASFNYKGLDLSKSSSLNYQGTGMIQWIYSLVVLFLVGLIYVPFQIFQHPWMGILFIGIAGLINFVLRDWWVDILYKQFIKNRYKILEGFREK